uniref:Peroxisomal membrane protein PEX16 n=1 Tax=Sinocyclocheilus grahami TaxID=75366 RepID=A0A672SS75_SINGR
MDKLSRIYERYQEYVRSNPAAASHVESAVRALSYLIAGERLRVKVKVNIIAHVLYNSVV